MQNLVMAADRMTFIASREKACSSHRERGRDRARERERFVSVCLVVEGAINGDVLGGSTRDEALPHQPMSHGWSTGYSLPG